METIEVEEDLFWPRKIYKFKGINNSIQFSEFFREAKREIKIVAGELYAPHYLNPLETNSIETAIKKVFKQKLFLDLLCTQKISVF